ETITMWIDEDRHDIKLIKQALKEAVLNEKMNLKYIDRILFEWKKKNITTSKEAVEQSKKFREHNMKSVNHEKVEDAPVKKAPFYNWLEERE
ncbi:MAG: DnaD domain protein, partial [Kurthia sp.]